MALNDINLTVTDLLEEKKSLKNTLALRHGHLFHDAEWIYYRNDGIIFINYY